MILAPLIDGDDFGQHRWSKGNIEESVISG